MRHGRFVSEVEREQQQKTDKQNFKTFNDWFDSHRNVK